AFCAGAKPSSGTVVPATTNCPSRTATAVSAILRALNSIDDERCGSPPGARLTEALDRNPKTSTGPTFSRSAAPVASDVTPPSAPWTTLAVDRAPSGASADAPRRARADDEPASLCVSIRRPGTSYSFFGVVG